MKKHLSHLDDQGRARMVDVGAKPVTHREAVAEGFVVMHADTLRAVVDGTLPKGEVLAVARVAGILAAKRTGELIPLCHPLPIDSVEIHFEPQPSDQQPGRIRITAAARITAKTGVEMEALTAVSVAALTIYDMCKAIDKQMTITDIRLLKKTGGTSKAKIDRIRKQIQRGAEQADRGEFVDPKRVFKKARAIVNRRRGKSS